MSNNFAFFSSLYLKCNTYLSLFMLALWFVLIGLFSELSLVPLIFIVIFYSIITQPYKLCTQRETKVVMVLSKEMTYLPLVNLLNDLLFVYFCRRLVAKQLLSYSPNISYAVYCAGKSIVRVVYCLSKRWLLCATVDTLYLPITFSWYTSWLLTVVTDWRLWRFMLWHFMPKCFLQSTLS